MAIKWALGFVCVGSVSVMAYLAAAWQPAIPPIDPPAAASFAPALVNKGKVLASAARCMDCHTTKDGRPGAGMTLKSDASSPSSSLRVSAT